MQRRKDENALNSKRLLVSSIRKIIMPGKPAMGCEAVGSQTTTAALSDSPRGAVGARANVPLRKQRRLLRRKIAVRSGTDSTCTIRCIIRILPRIRCVSALGPDT